MNAESITACSIVVLAAIAAFYAWETRKILDESARMRRAAEKQAEAAAATLEQLRKQVEDARGDRLRQEADQRKAIAAALIFEIVAFYHHYLVEIAAASKNAREKQAAPNQVFLKSPPTTSFPVYRANAGKIGEFRREEIEPVIAFYNAAESLLSALQDAIATAKMHMERRAAFSSDLAVASLGKLAASTIETQELAIKACSALAMRAEVPFDPAIANVTK